MPNTILTPQIIAKEALFQLRNNCVLGSLVHRGYKDEFAKIGDTVTIRRPVKFRSVSGATRSAQDVIETSTSVTIDQREHVSWDFSARELTLEIDEYSERYIKPAMIALGNQIDLHIAQRAALLFRQHIGTANTPPATFSALADIAAHMDALGVPDDGMRYLVTSPRTRWDLANGLGATSNAIFNEDMVEGMVRAGRLGRIANFDIYGDQNISPHLWGPGGGTPLMNGATANLATSLVIDGAPNNITPYARAGDIVTVAGCFEVNPVNRQSTGNLKQFRITTDANSDGAGNVTLLLDEAINDGSTASSAAYQNVDSLPANGAAVLFHTTPAGVTAPGAGAEYLQNLAFHKNALALVTVPVEIPDSAQWKARAEWDGYSIRVVKGYNVDSDVEAIRLDVMFGVALIYPELGFRVTG